jgi:hypothetical protein
MIYAVKTHDAEVTNLKLNTQYDLDKFTPKCSKQTKNKIVLKTLLEDTIFPLI